MTLGHKFTTLVTEAPKEVVTINRIGETTLIWCPDSSSLAILVLGTRDMSFSVSHEPAMGVLAGTQGNANRVTASGDEGQVPWAPKTSFPSSPRNT